MQLVSADDPILLKIAAPVSFPNSNLSQMVGNMLASMFSNHGCGLAAPQIGLDARIIVFSHNGRAGTLINPQIIYKSSETVEAQEGCLTFPGKFWKTTRAKDIRINYQNFAGQEVHDEVVEGFLAVIIQHECDHLNGILVSTHGEPLEDSQQDGGRG